MENALAARRTEINILQSMREILLVLIFSLQFLGLSSAFLFKTL
jgi:hypothetical protein